MGKLFLLGEVVLKGVTNVVQYPELLAKIREEQVRERLAKTAV